MRFGSLGLFLFGAAHVVLLWEGDILIIYSVTGTAPGSLAASTAGRAAPSLS
jgi:uncharacterized membrane protein YeiB